MCGADGPSAPRSPWYLLCLMCRGWKTKVLRDGHSWWPRSPGLSPWATLRVAATLIFKGQTREMHLKCKTPGVGQSPHGYGVSNSVQLHSQSMASSTPCTGSQSSELSTPIPAITRQYTRGVTQASHFGDREEKMTQMGHLFWFVSLKGFQNIGLVTS
jgi:hypothetical protein